MAPQRPLRLPHATALVVASMIGSGVFTTSGFMLREVGSSLAVLLLWAVAGLLSLGGAAVYAELGAMMPRAGGEYVYLSRAFHPAVGFVSGWLALVVGFAAPVAANALAFGGYLHGLLPAVPARPAALALIVATTLLHARDVRRAGWAQAAVTALVVGIIVAFLAGAALHADRLGWSLLLTDHVAAVPGSAGGLGVALAYVAYSYFGWNGAAYVAGEIRDPDRTLPRALLGGTALVTALYVALNVVFLAAASAKKLVDQERVAAIAAGALFGERGGTAISALVALALAGSVSALVMTGPRVVQAMAEDGVFFRALGRTNARGAPAAAVVLQGVLSLAFALTTSFDRLLVYAGFTLTVSAAVTIAGAFVLRRREPDAPRPHRALAWPWSGLAYLALTAFMSVLAIRERPLESLGGLATLAAGGVAWAVWRRRWHPDC